MSADLLAFEVTVHGEMRTIVFAATKAKAKYITYKGYREADYGRDGEWPPMTVKRVEMYDRCPLRENGPKCWTPEYVVQCT